MALNSWGGGRCLLLTCSFRAKARISFLVVISAAIPPRHFLHNYPVAFLSSTALTGPIIQFLGTICTLSNPPNLAPFRTLSELRSTCPLYSFLGFHHLATTTLVLPDPLLAENPYVRAFPSFPMQSLNPALSDFTWLTYLTSWPPAPQPAAASVTACASDATVGVSATIA